MMEYNKFYRLVKMASENFFSMKEVVKLVKIIQQVKQKVLGWKVSIVKKLINKEYLPHRHVELLY